MARCGLRDGEVADKGTRFVVSLVLVFIRFFVRFWVCYSSMLVSEAPKRVASACPLPLLAWAREYTLILSFALLRSLDQ